MKLAIFCPCGSGQRLRYLVLSKSAPPQSVCAACAERSPLGTRVVRLPAAEMHLAREGMP
jgi:hypothetical protein